MARWGALWIGAVLLGLFSALPAAAQTGADGGGAAEWKRMADFTDEDFISHVITAIDVDKSGRVWVGTDRGLVWTADSGRNWNVVNLAFASLRDADDADKDEPSNGRDLSGLPLQRRNSITSIKAGRTGLWVGTLNGLCFNAEDRRNWTLFTGSFNSPGPEIWAVETYEKEVWVSASNGLFRTSNDGTRWRRVPGSFPKPIRCIFIGEWGGKRAYWLAGFDSPPSYGGGVDVLRSDDDGATWDSFKTDTASPIARILSTRAHKLFMHGDKLWAATRHGLAYSRDGGEDWRRMSPQSGFDAEEAFAVTFQEGRLWVATNEGLFTSADDGKSWVQTGQLRGPVTEIRNEGIVLWMGTGSGLIRRMRGGDMKSFSVRSNILALARTKESEGEVWWAGTTGGLLFSRDQGRNWRSLTVADGLPSNMVLSLASDEGRIWAGTDGGVWTGADGGASSRQYGREQGLRGMSIAALNFDGTTLWAATNRGLARFVPDEQEWRTYQAGRDWHAVCVSGDVVYGAVSDPAQPEQGMSVISGKTEPEEWRVLDVSGYEGEEVHQLLALGGDVWMAADSGLFRSRDEGISWARFGAETLWSSRVTAMSVGEGGVLCVQAVPNDPPSSAGQLNVTRDGGRTWLVLPAAIPGHAVALMVGGEELLAGTAEVRYTDVISRGGLSIYTGFVRDLAAGRTGRLNWMRIAGYAASTFRSDGLGRVSVIDRDALHAPTVWFGSAGVGIVEKGIAALDDLTRAWDPRGQVPLDVRSFSFLEGKDVLAAAAAKDGLWFGTRDGLHFRDRLGRLDVYRPSLEGLIATPIHSLAVADDSIYVGTDYGLSVYDRSTASWRTFQKGPSPLPDNRIWALAFDGASVWGGTSDGAFRIAPDGSWKTLLSEEVVTDIAIGSEREYFATGRGVFARDRDGEARRHLQVVNSPLTDNDVKRVFIDGPELWAATARGVSRILYDRAEPPAQQSMEPSLRGPEGVLLVVNEESEGSLKVADAYRELRQVPEANVCRIECPPDETISRGDFEWKVREPILRHLLRDGLGRRISFIVTTYGVPLRVIPEPRDPSDAMRTYSASVDSELALIGLHHPLAGPIRNPYLHRDELFDSTRLDFYLVTRLDGPDPEMVIDRIRDGLVVEREQSFGARGFARFDLNPDEGPGADRVNRAIQQCYRSMRRQERFMGRIELPENTTLPFFRKDSAINTFFFLGWNEEDYSPEVFSWVQGAVGIALDPVTAATLKDPAKSWVAGAVRAGVVGSIGNVADPGRSGAPSVAGLFEYIRSGYTWGEAAYMCVPYLSWQTVVIGDPLYSPYR